MGNKLPEYEFIEKADGRKSWHLGNYWNAMSKEQRLEIIDRSGVADIATDNLWELADAFDTLVECTWNEIPKSMREFMAARIRVALPSGVSAGATDWRGACSHEEEQDG